MSLGESSENLIYLILAALGIILSAVFGLRAVARIFFGQETDELSQQTKKSPVTDLSISEMLPASVILSALLLIGLWPLSISERIDSEISSGIQFLI